jgi:hypothetical protein
MEEGIVYILTNPAMPNLVKIGMTTRLEVGIRMSELYTTGVPVPFECSFAGKVADVKKVEKAFHKAFGPYRINPNREFFEIEDTQAIGLLEIICSENLTPQIIDELEKVDEVSKDAGKRLSKNRRQRFNFQEMGIDVGTVLTSNHNEETCIVEDERNVTFRDEKMSLTRATRLKLDNSYNVAPGNYWFFKDKKLRELYNETYSEN